LALPYRWQRRIERWKNAMRGFLGGNQTPRPKICPACGALVGINTTRCHECGSSLTFSLAALNKKLSGIIGSDAPVTTVLLISNIMIFGITLVMNAQAGEAGGLRSLWGMSPDVIYRLGAIYPPSLFYLHEWWRLVTAMFLHGGILHIGFNMAALYQLGPAVEELYGSARYLFVYVVAGAFGFLVSAFAGHFSLGASGALLGLVGVMLAVTSKRGGSYMRQLRSQLVSSVVILFALGLFGGFGIDNWAHGGGLAAGFVLGRMFADREPATPREKSRAAVLGWVSGIVILVSFVLMLMHFHDPTPFGR